MKKRSLNSILIIFLAAFLMLVPFSSAALDIKKTDKGSAVFSEINNPAIFDFSITNNGEADNFQIYSLIGITMTPRGTFDLPKGASNIEVRAYPNSDLRKQTGSLTFEYEIKGQNSGITKDKLTIQVVSLKDALEIESSNVNLGDETATLTVKNLQNTNIENLAIRFESELFDDTKVISLKPYETANVTIKIDDSKIKGVSAGTYIITGFADPEGANVKLEGSVKYLEQQGISFAKSSTGFILRKTTITKENEGNTLTAAKIEISKDIISRLFTTYSLDPASSVRSGLSVVYVWERTLAPGESFTVNSTTNYTFPFILIILVVLITVLVRIYTQTNLILEKRVSFVKTKGGEFALRVKVHVKSKKHVDNIEIIDRLPGGMKLYEKFGVQPDRIENGKLFWNIEKLNAGEERVFSYVIHSKIKIVGRFELPASIAVFEEGGKTHEVSSNRAFFVAETSSGLY